MTDIQIDAGTLTASVSDRTVSGLLVPFGEECASNLGKFTFDKGAVTIPADVANTLSFNVEHAREAVIGRGVTAMETPAGIVATFRIADGEDGDKALADIESGKRKHLSAEVSNVVIKNGKGISGKLFAAALVEKPAFPSATLLAAADDTEPVAAETPDAPVLTPDEDGDIAIDASAIPETVTVTAGDETSTFTPKESEADVADAVIPDTFKGAQVTERALSLSDVSGLLYAANNGTLDEAGFDKLKNASTENPLTLYAALNDVKYDGTGGLAPAMTASPQWIGEVWQAASYEQQVAPLFDHAPLTGLNIAGFKWGTRPAGGAWSGNKSDVPSNTPTVTAVTVAATRWAAGHDIAREFLDFGTPGFFESYAKAITEDYLRWVDGKVATAVLAGATTLAGDALTTLPGATGGTIGSAASAIIDGAVAVANAGATPSFALVAPALWKQLVKMPSANVLGYLNAVLGLKEGDLEGFTIRPSASVAAGKVLVGARQAATVYELPGVPIRIDALDLAKGGLDKAAFGYAGVLVNDATALQLVTAATA